MKTVTLSQTQINALAGFVTQKLEKFVYEYTDIEVSDCKFWIDLLEDLGEHRLAKEWLQEALDELDDGE